jgi:hypothetical protein
MNNGAEPPHRMPLMLENGQDYSLRERQAANQKNSISGTIFICRGQFV